MKVIHRMLKNTAGHQNGAFTKHQVLQFGRAFRFACKPLLALFIASGAGTAASAAVDEKNPYPVDGVSSATSLTQPYDEAKLALVASQFKVSEAPAKIHYQEQLSKALKSAVPVLGLELEVGSKPELAQRLVLAHPAILESTFSPRSGAPLRSEVMSVKPALPGDIVGANGACDDVECFRVNLYNFYVNATVSALVDVTNKRVVAVGSIAETQPELSERLSKLAVEIAKFEPAVQLEVSRYLAFIGDKTSPKELRPVMVDTKSALRDTLCERSKHLCVAPTYVLGDMAMWVIVDLTEMKVAGVRWTKVGDAGPPTIITERILENEYVFKNFCESVSNHEQNGWRFDYHITSSDGLRIANATYQGKPVFSSAKVVDWHVAYSRKDAFGYSDATGCPIFSSAVVVAFTGPKIKPIKEAGKTVGFYIAQEFQQQSWPAPCNYRYEERYEFYNDGRYRAAMISHGRGCGSYGTYRPVFRMDLGQAADKSNYRVERWADSWKAVSQETWARQKEPERLSQARFSHRIVDGSGDGYLLEPGAGKFNDGGRGDNAYLYFTVNHPDKDEGNRDLVTLGSCCNTNYEQGPELFMQPAEPLSGEPVVLWYVPQMTNDGRAGHEYCWAENQVENGVLKTQTWPCTAGPMFTPINTFAPTKEVAPTEVGGQ